MREQSKQCSWLCWWHPAILWSLCLWLAFKSMLAAFPSLLELPSFEQFYHFCRYSSHLLDQFNTADDTVGSHRHSIKLSRMDLHWQKSHWAFPTVNILGIFTFLALTVNLLSIALRCICIEFFEFHWVASKKTKSKTKWESISLMIFQEFREVVVLKKCYLTVN